MNTITQQPVPNLGAVLNKKCGGTFLKCLCGVTKVYCVAGTDRKHRLGNQSGIGKKAEQNYAPLCIVFG